MPSPLCCFFADRSFLFVLLWVIMVCHGPRVAERICLKKGVWGGISALAPTSVPRYDGGQVALAYSSCTPNRDL